MSMQAVRGFRCINTKCSIARFRMSSGNLMETSVSWPEKICWVDKLEACQIYNLDQTIKSFINQEQDLKVNSVINRRQTEDVLAHFFGPNYDPRHWILNELKHLNRFYRGKQNKHYHNHSCTSENWFFESWVVAAVSGCYLKVSFTQSDSLSRFKCLSLCGLSGGQASLLAEVHTPVNFTHSWHSTNTLII